MSLPLSAAAMNECSWSGSCVWVGGACHGIHMDVMTRVFKAVGVIIYGIMIMSSVH